MGPVQLLFIAFWYSHMYNAELIHFQEGCMVDASIDAPASVELGDMGRAFWGWKGAKRVVFVV